MKEKLIRNTGSVVLAITLVFIVLFAFQLIGTKFSHAQPAGRSVPMSLDQSTSGPEKESCTKPPSLCEAYWSSSAVFTGKVLKISPLALICGMEKRMANQKTLHRAIFGNKNVSRQDKAWGHD
jgi:hypothetical protein